MTWRSSRCKGCACSHTGHRPVKNAPPDSFSQLLDELDDSAEAAVTYWNYNISEFGRAPLAPALDRSRRHQGASEAGQITIAGISI